MIFVIQIFNTLFCFIHVVFKPLSLSCQEKNLKAEEEQRRQQKEREEIEKLRQAEERKRYIHMYTF